MKLFRFCVFVFACLLFSSCGKDTEIRKILQDLHEEEIKESVDSFYELDTFFARDETGKIFYSKNFENIVIKIENLHKQYHNSEILPRDSEKWETLMYYVKNPDKKNHPSTVCPYCLAEAIGNLDTDEIDWGKTYLFSENIIKRQKELYQILKDDEMKELLSKFKNYLKTNKCFIDKETKNTILLSTVGNNKYSIISTTELNQFFIDMQSFHNNNCTYNLFGTIADTLFYDSSFTRNEQISCPICQIAHKQQKENIFTKEDKNFSYSFFDLYFWEEDGFAYKIFSEYKSAKEKEKLIASLPLYDSWTLDSKMRSGEAKRKELDGKLVKVEGNIYSINNYSSDLDEIEFTMMSGLPSIVLPKTITKNLNSGDYIVFTAKIKLTDDSYKYKFTDCEFVKKERNINDSYFNFF